MAAYIGCPHPEWQSANYDFHQLPPEAQKMTMQVVQRMKRVLNEDAKDVETLVDLYRHHLLETFRKALGGDFAIEQGSTKDPNVRRYVIDYAFYLRWREVKPETLSRFQEVFGRR